MAKAPIGALALLLCGCVFDNRGLPHSGVDNRLPDAPPAEARPDLSDLRGPELRVDVRQDGPPSLCGGDGPVCLFRSTDGGGFWRAGDCLSGAFNYRRSCHGGNCEEGVCQPPPFCVACGSGCSGDQVCSGFAGVQASGGLVLKTCCVDKEAIHGSGLGDTPCAGNPSQCATGLCTAAGTCFEACTKTPTSDSCPAGRTCQQTAVLEAGKQLPGLSCLPQPKEAGPEASTPDLGQDAGMPDLGLPDAAQPDTASPDAAQPDVATLGSRSQRSPLPVV